MKFFDGDYVIAASDSPRETINAAKLVALFGISTTEPRTRVFDGGVEIASQIIDTQPVPDELDGVMLEQVVFAHVALSAVGIVEKPVLGVGAAGNIVLLQSNGGFQNGYLSAPFWWDTPSGIQLINREGVSQILVDLADNLPSADDIVWNFVVGGFTPDRAEKEAATVSSRLLVMIA